MATVLKILCAFLFVCMVFLCFKTISVFNKVQPVFSGRKKLIITSIFIVDLIFYLLSFTFLLKYILR